MTIDIKKVFVRGLQDSCVREFVFEEDFNIIHGSTVFHSHPSHSDAVYCSKVYG